jgi:hypothetical protein
MVALLAIVVTVAPALRADTVLYSTSFENPPFTPGPIAGQDGWGVFGPGISTVENTFAKSGSQGVFVDGGTASQSGPFHADSAPGPLIDLSADIAIFTSSTQTEWQFAARGPGLVGFIGGIDVLPNNQIEAITPGFTVVGTFPRATAFDGTAWHHIDLLLDMATQTYNLSLDGTLLGSNLAFCGSNAGCSGAVVPTYGDGFFDSFGTGNDSGYMDNYRVANATPVPEPTSLSMIAAGLVFGLGRFRRGAFPRPVWH